MRYEMMFPHQIRKAIDENWPVVLPIGVLEYHSEHCAVGVDTLLVIRAVEMLEKEIDLVVLPPFHYGAVSYAVEPPERNGSIHIDSDTVHAFARKLFTGLLRVGFRNIHGFIHHQSENFSAGMPTDLAFKFAARQCTFEFIEQEKGEGWWGSEESANYYSQHESGTDPFNWIQLHPFMDAEAQSKYPVDHAALQETSLMLAFAPEGVDMDKFTDEKWYAREAKKATIEYGNAAKEMILNSMRKILKGE